MLEASFSKQPTGCSRGSGRIIKGQWQSVRVQSNASKTG